MLPESRVVGVVESVSPGSVEPGEDNPCTHGVNGMPSFM